MEELKVDMTDKLLGGAEGGKSVQIVPAKQLEEGSRQIKTGYSI